jgi:sulfite reductase (ferredoxin)
MAVGVAVAAWALLASYVGAYRAPARRGASRLAPRMVLGERAPPSNWRVQGLDGVNKMKLESDYLRHPLVEDLGDLESISISHDSYNLLKFHGSYQQDDRSKRKKGAEKAWQFMLRLKVPAGECPGPLYLVLDDLCENYGQKDLRMTTRQAFQIHGILKKDLKAVIRAIMDAGSTTIGGCGDINRNVMTPPAPIDDDARPAYRVARKWSAICAELFVPQTEAFSEIWCDNEKLASVQYWKRHIEDAAPPLADFDKARERAVDDRVQDWMRRPSGRGVVLDHPVEPIYGDTYLPRKFKIGVTVEGDNSIDVFINDIGVVVLEDGSGFNVYVGGGLGRTHGKETTFARAASPLGFFAEDDLVDALKAIVACQRDHGNREVRANARLKYLVHTLGEAPFRSLVESYLGAEIAPVKDLKPWRYSDWMGWHDAGDGSLFLGLNCEQGRIRDYAEGPQWRKFLRAAVADFGVDLILSPTQSIVLKGVAPGDRGGLEALMAAHGILPVEAIDPLTRLSMACPALPLCGLAVTEAERYMPTMVRRVRGVLDHLGLDDDELMLRMTGCPNGCARPYMAELAFVGDGKNSYQLYVGGSPLLTRVGFEYKERCKTNTMEHTLEPLFAMWRDQRTTDAEAFGDFAKRVGQPALAAFAADYTCTSAILAD